MLTIDRETPMMLSADREDPDDVDNRYRRSAEDKCPKDPDGTGI